MRHNRVAAALVIAALLGGCGGESAEVSDDHLSKALLSTADLPPGWEGGPRSELQNKKVSSRTDACPKRYLATNDDLATGATAEAGSFFKGPGEAFLFETLLRHPSGDVARERVAAVASVVAGCPSFIAVAKGRRFKTTLRRLSYPRLGDETFAWSITSQEGTAAANIHHVVIVRSGQTLLSSDGRWTTPGPQMLAEVTRAALAKLQPVLQP